MRPYLSWLSSELCRLWFLCGSFLFASQSFACAWLPFWSNDVDEFSARRPLVTKSSSPAVLDVVNGGSEGQSIASSQTVGGHPELYEKFDKPVALPPMHGVYNWSHLFELPQQGQGVVFFTADCSHDVHVAISPQPQSMKPMYEFVTGGWSNTASVIRRRSQGSNVCTVPVGLDKSRPDTMNDLWISIDKTMRFLWMGHGREPGLESMFLVYKDPKFSSEARYVCFTTWDVPATYSDIMVLAME